MEGLHLVTGPLAVWRVNQLSQFKAQLDYHMARGKVAARKAGCKLSIACLTICSTALVAERLLK